jgi:D-glycero-beta-D-manno-heptose-7-phosphate kinase
MIKSEDIFEAFKKLKVLIIGDVMIDRYLYGKVNRISPEAPVPVVEYIKSENRLGGAANVALNIKALGAEPYLFSVTSKDTEGSLFLKLMKDNMLSTIGITQSAERTTTIKTRIMANSQQLLRIDSENTQYLMANEEDLFLKKIRKLLKNEKIDIIIFQDYNKGVLTKKVINEVIILALKQGIPTAVDPKKHHFFEYKNVTLFKPNLKEIRESLPLSIEVSVPSLQEAASYLRHKIGHHFTMITLSNKGLFLDAATEGGCIYPTQPRSIADVSGAGDTVISIASLGLALGLDMPTIAHLSNIAGGQVCEISGVVPVNKDTLKQEFDLFLK